MRKVEFVTGASRGIDAHLAEAVLAAGGMLVACQKCRELWLKLTLI
jgi:NAD(P)-dependent dehydrogenase (short-subunit alcohol dehydrogenase family)